MSPKRILFKYYDVILASFVALLLISNIAGVKLISLGPIITDGGAILFPLTYILGDILTEVYGYKYARRAIWTAFSLMAVMSVVLIVVGALPAADAWENQSSWDAVLGFVPRIVIASLVAFVIGQFVNAFVLAKLKVATGGKKMWLRLIGSTLIGELLDTTIFALIAFGGILSGQEMIGFIAFGWAFKTLVEVVMLPITFRIITKLKAAEHYDADDRTTNFKPFEVKV